jgi:hypothetical protein
MAAPDLAQVMEQDHRALDAFAKTETMERAAAHDREGEATGSERITGTRPPGSIVRRRPMKQRWRGGTA